MTTIVFLYLILGDKDLRRISPKSARILALCGDHSNYTFEQAGYNTAGRGQNKSNCHYLFLYSGVPTH
jgi:hypothetical protein